MHESSLMSSLMRTIEGIARENPGAKVAAVEIRLGALCPISPDHLREHFILAARGTPAEQGQVEVSARK